MTVTVITDSAAALPADVAEGFGVPVVPLWLHVGADSYRDGELALSDFLARLDEPCSTAAPSPGEFAKAIETAAENGPVVVLTVAATMSSTYASALLASRQTSADVTIVDTRSAAGAQGLVVVAAARAAAKGASVDEILGVARLVSERVRLVATVPDVTRLARSGRLPAAAGRLGARIGAQPMFELRKGRVRPMRPAFSRAAALDRIAERCAGGRPGRSAPRRRAARARSRRRRRARRARHRPRAGHVRGRLVQPGDGGPHRRWVGRRRVVARAVSRQRCGRRRRWSARRA